MAEKKDELDRRIDEHLNDGSGIVQFLIAQIEYEREITRRELTLRERKMILAEHQAEHWGKLMNTAAALIPAYLSVINELKKTPPYPIHKVNLPPGFSLADFFSSSGVPPTPPEQSEKQE